VGWGWDVSALTITGALSGDTGRAEGGHVGQEAPQGEQRGLRGVHLGTEGESLPVPPEETV